MISRSSARRVLPPVLILVLILAAACSSSNPASPGSTAAVTTSSATSPGTGSSPTGGPTLGSTGTLRVMLKDSPFSEASAVFVTFSSVSVHTSEGGWMTLDLADRNDTFTCDLKKLANGAKALLGVGEIPSGHYTQIRLMVKAEETWIYQGGETIPSLPACTPTDEIDVPVKVDPTDVVNRFPVTVPSGEVKLNREFTLGNLATVEILLDFEGDKSIIKQAANGQDTPKYIMKPVIGVASVNVVVTP